MSAGMAYEAMNNAGALQLAADRHPQRQRHVDRAAGRRACRPISRASSPAAPIARCATSASSSPSSCRKFLETARGRDGGIRPRLRHRRHAVRGARLLSMSARSTATISTTCCRCCSNVRDAKNGPILVHVVTQEGQGLRAGRGLRRQVSRRRQVRRRHRRAGEVEVERADLHQGLRREPDQGGAQGRQDRRHHRRDAVRHRARPVRQGIPQAHASTSASPSSTR